MDRRTRQLVRNTAVLQVPPPPAAWARWGNVALALPARVSNAECISLGDGVSIGEDVMLMVSQWFPDVTPQVVIGDGTRIGRCCSFGIIGGLEIGRDVVIGDFAMIIDTVHPFEVEDRLNTVTPPEPVRIGDGAILGTHVTVLPGVTIGAGARVGHHSVVAKDVGPGESVSGYPARKLKAVAR